MSIDLKKLAIPFPENEIEWRIGQCGKKGNGQIWATCLAYVQARAIMNRLDDICGPENWCISYDFIKGDQAVTPGVIGNISIFYDNRWISKADGAEQTDIESFKGGLSSALKRAGSVWGIGRYLYGLDSGFAQISNNGKNWGKTKDGTEFHWDPPRLPAWALPDGSGVESNGIHPEDPGTGNGDTTPRGWVFGFGQWKARTVEQVYNDPKFGPEKLSGYIEYLEGNSNKTGKPLGQQALEAIEHIEHFLGAMENGLGA